MSRLDTAARVYPKGFEDQDDYEAVCMWFALCKNPANGVRDHPVLGNVPICQRCDDKVERMSNA